MKNLLLLAIVFVVMPSLASDTAPDVAKTCDWTDIPCAITGFISWLREAFLYIPRMLWNDLLLSLLTLINNIPVPAAVAQAKSSLTAFISAASYLSYVFAIVPGMALVFGALLARFLLRRIPLIG